MCAALADNDLLNSCAANGTRLAVAAIRRGNDFENRRRGTPNRCWRRFGECPLEELFGWLDAIFRLVCL